LASFQLRQELVRLDTAVREWAGLAVYAMLGRTDRLFPAP
jgi:hypothetical protein